MSPLKNNGMTLIELMVTLGLSGILTLGISQLVVTQQKSEAVSIKNFAAYTAFIEFKEIFKKEDNCATTFQKLYEDKTPVKLTITPQDVNIDTFYTVSTNGIRAHEFYSRVGLYKTFLKISQIQAFSSSTSGVIAQSREFKFGTQLSIFKNLTTVKKFTTFTTDDSTAYRVVPATFKLSISTTDPEAVKSADDINALPMKTFEFDLIKNFIIDPNDHIVGCTNDSLENYSDKFCESGLLGKFETDASGKSSCTNVHLGSFFDNLSPQEVDSDPIYDDLIASSVTDCASYGICSNYINNVFENDVRAGLYARGPLPSYDPIPNAINFAPGALSQSKLEVYSPGFDLSTGSTTDDANYHVVDFVDGRASVPQIFMVSKEIQQGRTLGALLEERNVAQVSIRTLPPEAQYVTDAYKTSLLLQSNAVNAYVETIPSGRPLEPPYFTLGGICRVEIRSLIPDASDTSETFTGNYSAEECFDKCVFENNRFSRFSRDSESREKNKRLICYLKNEHPYYYKIYRYNRFKNANGGLPPAEGEIDILNEAFDSCIDSAMFRVTGHSLEEQLETIRMAIESAGLSDTSPVPSTYGCKFYHNPMTVKQFKALFVPSLPDSKMVLDDSYMKIDSGEKFNFDFDLDLDSLLGLGSLYAVTRCEEGSRRPDCMTAKVGVGVKVGTKVETKVESVGLIGGSVPASTPIPTPTLRPRPGSSIPATPTALNEDILFSSPPQPTLFYTKKTRIEMEILKSQIALDNPLAIDLIKVNPSSAVSTTSDERRKTEIKGLSKNIVNKLGLLRSKKFTWKNGDPTWHYGLIAQDVNRIFPNVVHQKKSDAFKKLDYTSLLPLVLENIKENKRKIINLKKRIKEY